jgi:hypothetical protein
MAGRSNAKTTGLMTGATMWCRRGGADKDLNWLTEYSETVRVLLEAMLLLAAFCGGAFAEEILPPTHLELYGRNSGGSEVISGECQSVNSRETEMSCDFVHLEIVQPSGHIDEATQTELDIFEYEERPSAALATRLTTELNQLIPKEEKLLHGGAEDVERLKQDLAEHRECLDDLRNHRPFLTEKDKAAVNAALKNNPLVTDVKQRAALLNDPSTGPKLRAYYLQRFAAEHDFAEEMKVEVNKSLRTCQGILKTFSAKFKQLGKGRWLSEEIQSLDFCRAVIVFELTSKDGIFWSLKESFISVKDSPACKASADETGSLAAKLYSNQNVDEFEPQCDFISWFGGVGPSLSP